MKKRLLHPINILENISSRLILLILPVIRAFFHVLVTGQFASWLAGAWLDVLVVLVILGSGVYRWRATRYRYSSEGIWLYKGLIFSSVRFLSRQEISYLSRQEPWYLRPIGAVRLYADTDGGKKRGHDISLTLTKTQSREMVHTVFSTSLEEVAQRYEAPPKRVALHIFLYAGNFSGLLYFVTAVSAVMKLFGSQMQSFVRQSVQQVADFLSYSLSPALALIAAALLFLWGGVFAVHLVYLLRFRCTRTQNLLRLSCGLVSRYRTHISVRRIYSVTIVESNLSRLLKYAHATIRCSGYGKQDGANGLLVPTCPAEELRARVRELLPEWKVSDNLYTSKGAFWRYMGASIWTTVSVTALMLPAHFLLAEMRLSLWIAYASFFFPMLWLAALRLQGYRHSGVGLREDWLTVRTVQGYRMTTTVFRVSRLVKIRLRQSPFQRKSGQCDLIFYVCGAFRSRLVLGGLQKAQALELLERLNLKGE